MAEAAEEVSSSPPETLKEDVQTDAGPTPRTAQAPAASKSVPDGPQERKGKMYMEEAEKKMKSSQSFFGGMFGWGC